MANKAFIDFYIKNYKLDILYTTQTLKSLKIKQLTRPPTISQNTINYLLTEKT